MINVPMSRAEALAVGDTLGYLLWRSDPDDPDVAVLRGYYERLRAKVADWVCVHCGLRFSRRRDRICDACNAYRHKHGELPPDDIYRTRLEQPLKSVTGG